MDKSFARCTRGRALGNASILLVDCFWDVHQGPVPPQSCVLTMGDQACRPRRSSLVTVADHWVLEVVDDDTAGDYVTGDSEGLEPGWERSDDLLLPEATSDEVASLRQKVQELEALVQQQARVTSVSRPVGRGVLFDGAPMISKPQEAANTLAKLQSLAGAAPLRLGTHERQRAVAPAPPGMEALQQESGLEALEEAEVEAGLQELEGALEDPMQKMVFLQMQQLAMLTKQQAHLAQPRDPISAALSGGSDAQSTGSSGIKGCMAREAYIKQLGDMKKCAAVVAENVASELGIEVGQGSCETTSRSGLYWARIGP